MTWFIPALTPAPSCELRRQEGSRIHGMLLLQEGETKRGKELEVTRVFTRAFGGFSLTKTNFGNILGGSSCTAEAARLGKD